ncbi:hypothetical protein VBZ67_11485 [Campylobacter concisus]
MTALEKALLEENERLTKMIEDERSKHELETMNLQQDCEKELVILRTNVTALIKKVKSLNKDCNDALTESLQQQRDMYESSISCLEEKLKISEEKFQNFERSIRELTDRAQDATRICREFIEEREYSQKASIYHHVGDVCKEKTQSLDMF